MVIRDFFLIELEIINPPVYPGVLLVLPSSSAAGSAVKRRKRTNYWEKVSFMNFSD